MRPVISAAPHLALAPGLLSDPDAQTEWWHYAGHLDLTLEPVKPLVRSGDGEGLTRKDDFAVSRHMSFPRARAAGTLALGRESLPAAGDAWIDREHGSFRLGTEFAGWDWFAIQFDDGCELMIYRFRDHEGGNAGTSTVTWIDAGGRSRQLEDDDLRIEAGTSWTSPVSKICYPVAWRLVVPALSLELQLKSQLDCHELDARSSSGLFYSEAPVEATGTREERPVSGRGFAEQVTPPPIPLTGLYDFRRENLGLLDWLTDDLQLPFRCRGSSVSGSRPPPGCRP